MAFQSIKCVLVGSKGSGKTAMFMTYRDGAYPVPIESFNNCASTKHSSIISTDGTKVMLEVWDTSAQEEYSALRPLAYPQTDVFLVCFSIANSTHYEEVKSKWVPEVAYHCPNSCLIIVGTMADLRCNKDYQCISRNSGEQLLKSVKASMYCECSSLYSINVKHIFEELLMRSMFVRPRTRKLIKQEKFAEHVNTLLTSARTVVSSGYFSLYQVLPTLFGVAPFAILTLPRHILVYVFSFLDVQSVIRC